jgi:hypothetical protein
MSDRFAADSDFGIAAWNSIQRSPFFVSTVFPGQQLLKLP